MKKLKKLFAVMLSLIMVLAMGITSFAADAGTDGKFGTADDTGTITVTGVEENATVTAYKVVEAKYEDNGGSFSGYNSLYTSVIPNNRLQANLNITREELNKLADAVNADTTKTAISMAYANGSWTATVKPGTYLVLVTNAETNAETNIYNPMVVSVYYTNADGTTNNLHEGNLGIAEGGATAKVSRQPEVDKVITSGNGTDKGNSANAGDTVSYKVSVNPVPNYNGTYPKLNVVDTLDKGLQYTDGSLKVVVKGANTDGKDKALDADTDYTFTSSVSDGKTVLTVDFVVDGKYTLNAYAGKEVEITYNATLTSDATLNNIATQQSLKKQRAYNEALLPSILPDSFAIAEATEGEDKAYMDCLNIAGDGMMGIVEIPKIDIKLPIYHTTGEDVLQVAAGHLEGSSLPVGGASTHAVISAHRGLPSASLFTDLDKLEEGDHFLIHVLNETLCYEVDKISVVKPEETSGLAVEEGKDLVTLLTCTPYGVNTERLLVRGHRVEYVEQEVEAEKTLFSGISMHTNYLLWVIVGLLVTAAFIVVLYKKEQKLKKRRAEQATDEQEAPVVQDKTVTGDADTETEKKE